MIHDIGQALEQRCCGELDVLGDDAFHCLAVVGALPGILARGVVMVQARM